jgi:hypothetical protein
MYVDARVGARTVSVRFSVRGSGTNQGQKQLTASENSDRMRRQSSATVVRDSFQRQVTAPANRDVMLAL